MKDKSQLKGVGGWLGFLVFSLVALGPVLGFGRTYGEISTQEDLYPALLGNGDWGVLKAWIWVTFAISAAISVSAGVRLNTVMKSSSVRFAIICLWLMGPVMNGISMLGVTAILDVEGVEPQLIGQLVASGIIAAIWTAYLKLSFRVKNTYGTEEPSGPSWLSRRWQGVGRGRRQYLFFSIAWIIMVLLAVQMFEPFGAYMSDAEANRALMFAFMPPFLYGVGRWSYRRFVG